MAIKILSVISTFRGGVGGHYHSCATIARSIGELDQVSVLNVGAKRSPIINDKIPNSYFLELTANTFRSNFRSIEEFVKLHNFKILHSYDIWTLYLCSILGKKCNIPHVHTKCGGPPFRVHLPSVEALILFSLEDKLHIEKFYPNITMKTFLIPNRVEVPISDHIRLMETRKKLDANNLNFLLICRIAREYEEVFDKSINLINLLRGMGVKATITIIGNIQDLSIYEKVKLKTRDHVMLKSEASWTSNASSLIQAFDFVIGQGRSFMEGAILGKPTLCFSSDLPYPVLPDCDTIDHFAKYNFSKRARLRKDNRCTLSNLAELCQNSSKLKTYKLWIKNYADDNFNVQYARDKYRNIYEEALRLGSVKQSYLSELWWKSSLLVALFDYERIYLPPEKRILIKGIKATMLRLISLGNRAVNSIKRKSTMR